MPVDPSGPDDFEPLSDDEIAEMNADLLVLQRPFAPDEIERLPKPTFKNAWSDKPKGHCDECGGYHCLSNTIHLDYIGHAQVTKRLLEADPLWDWEPLAMGDDGLPRIDQFGGLWIKLRVCGVTRLGYGDAVGKAAGTTAVKEMIGDAIRNAAMRFGVALDLWSKISLHEGKNPGATDETQNWQRSEANRSGSQNSRRPQGSNGGEGRVPDQGGQADAPRAANQDALDALGDVCDEYGYDRRTMREEYAKWAAKVGKRKTELTEARPDDITLFSAELIAQAEPPDSAEDSTTGGGSTVSGGPAADADEAQAGPGPEAPVSPADTSDVEKQPGEAF